MTEKNIEYIDVYIFMTYENVLKTLEKGRLKVLFPEECNDPFEFMSAPPTKMEDGHPSFDSAHFRKEYGFLSFTKTYKSSTMWSHYADKHKGCCVHFRFPSLPEQVSPCVTLNLRQKYPSKYRELLINHAGPCFFTTSDQETGETKSHVILWNVLYQKERIDFHGILSGQTSYENKNEFIISSFFITKDESWEYEQEKRIIIPTLFPTEVEDNLVFVRGFNKYIKSIILGMNCPHPEGLTKSLINALTLGEKNGTKITYSDKLNYYDQINVSRVRQTTDTFEVISDEHEDFLKFLKENGE